MVIRIRRQDTAFLYRLLEGYEYYAHYTTLPCDRDVGYRDIQLNVGKGLEEEFAEILQQLPLEFRIL